MKAPKLLLCIVVLLCQTGFSQEVTTAKQAFPLCNSFDLLVQSAASNFSNLKGAKTSNANGKEFYSTIEIKDAKSSTINGFLDYYSFHADFGRFASNEEASKFMKDLQAEFVKCKPGFEFVIEKDRQVGQYHYYLVNKHNAGVRYYNAYLDKRKVDNQFEVSFTMYKNDLLREYIFLSNEPDQSQQQCKEVRKIVDASKTKFEGIRGELTNNGYIEFYNSNFCLTGLSNCRIFPVNVFHKQPTFQVQVAGNLSQDNATKMLESVSALIAASLGKGYAAGSSKNGARVAFCLKDDIGREGKELVVIEKKESSLSFSKTVSVSLEFYSIKAD